jgi:hypothetical protein
MGSRRLRPPAPLCTAQLSRWAGWRPHQPLQPLGTAGRPSCSAAAATAAPQACGMGGGAGGALTRGRAGASSAAQARRLPRFAPSTPAPGPGPWSPSRPHTVATSVPRGPASQPLCPRAPPLSQVLHLSAGNTTPRGARLRYNSRAARGSAPTRQRATARRGPSHHPLFANPPPQGGPRLPRIPAGRPLRPPRAGRLHLIVGRAARARIGGRGQAGVGRSIACGRPPFLLSAT